MEWIDISLPIEARYPSWPGQPGMELRVLSSFEAGAEAANTELSLFSHFGTHLDAPRHFVAGGQTVDALALDRLMGPCCVIDCGTATVITAAVLAGHDLAGVARLLCRTANSQRIHDGMFHEDYVGFDRSGVEALLAAGVRVAGVDYFSAATLADAVAVHRRYLGAGGIFIEGVDLGRVAPGVYELVALPLRVTGAEAAPARVVLGRR